MITDEDAEKTLDWLVRNADKAAKARATREYLEGYTKALKGLLMGQAPGDSMAAKETAAFSHPDYVKHLEALRIAIEDDERFRWLRVAAEAKISMFQTYSANERVKLKI